MAVTTTDAGRAIELAKRADEIEALIEELRAQQTEPDFYEFRAAWQIRAAWQKTWANTFAELRGVQREIAELTPLQPAEVRELARVALEHRAHEWTALGEHGNGVPAYRMANGLASVAALFADDGTSRHRFIVNPSEMTPADFEALLDDVVEEAGRRGYDERLVAWAMRRTEGDQ